VVEGNGVVRANGGGVVTDIGAGGGSGRVAVYHSDLSGFSGAIQARGARVEAGVALRNGGAGTIYLKRSTDALGELIIDNGGAATPDWSTPLPSQGILRLQSWIISGNARVLTTDGVRLANGDPSLFQGLISSNYHQVGSLVVSNTWVFGEVIDLSASHSNGVVLVSVVCRPQKNYFLLATTNFVNWVTVATNTPTSTKLTIQQAILPGSDARLFVRRNWPFRESNESAGVADHSRRATQPHAPAPSLGRFAKLDDDFRNHSQRRHELAVSGHERARAQPAFLPRRRSGQVAATRTHFPLD